MRRRSSVAVNRKKPKFLAKNLPTVPKLAVDCCISFRVRHQHRHLHHHHQHDSLSYLFSFSAPFFFTFSFAFYSSLSLILLESSLSWWSIWLVCQTMACASPLAAFSFVLATGKQDAQQFTSQPSVLCTMGVRGGVVTDDLCACKQW